uniref:Uncharacterized protein n=2 Tax=Paracidobacterium acidisoli TaxID=2303751 RepID=A0A372IPQ0_9BACT
MLRQFFHEVVSGCYPTYTGLDDSEVTTYIADLLTEFTASENLYRIRDASGKPLREIGEMLTASDPVLGSAPSFDAEREMRRHIGDFALFSTGMYPESMHMRRNPLDADFMEMVRTGKESYYIVSQFDLFEYKQEAPFFARLSEEFERCMYGLTKVREELDRLGAPKMLM